MEPQETRAHLLSMLASLISTRNYTTPFADRQSLHGTALEVGIRNKHAWEMPVPYPFLRFHPELPEVSQPFVLPLQTMRRTWRWRWWNRGQWSFTCCRFSWPQWSWQASWSALSITEPFVGKLEHFWYFSGVKAQHGWLIWATSERTWTWAGIFTISVWKEGKKAHWPWELCKSFRLYTIILLHWSSKEVYSTLVCSKFIHMLQFLVCMNGITGIQKDAWRHCTDPANLP